MTTFVFSALAVLAIAAICLLGGCASNSAKAGISPGAVSAGYTCPLTGEQLPCPKCCPLNKQ